MRVSESSQPGAVSLCHLLVPHVDFSFFQAEAAVAAVAVADTVRDCPPAAGPDGMSKAWGRGAACTSALVTPAPGPSAGGSTGPSAAASFFIRYVLRGHMSHSMLGNGGPEFLVPGGLWHILGRTVAQSVKEGRLRTIVLSSSAEGLAGLPGTFQSSGA